MNRILINIFVCVLLASCGQQRKLMKAIEVLDRDENKIHLAKMCHLNFPSVNRVDTVRGVNRVDTVFRQKEDVYVVDCPPSPAGVKIEYRSSGRDTVYRETRIDTIRTTKIDSSYHYIITDQKNDLQNQVYDLEKKVKNRTRFMWVFLIAFLVSAGLHFVRR